MARNRAFSRTKVMMGLPGRDDERHTYGDYLGWPDDVRYELIDGVAYLMASAPALAHQDVVGEVYFQLRRALEDTPCRVYVAPVDVRLPKANEADADIDTVVQPDVIVLCDLGNADKRGIRGARVLGGASRRPHGDRVPVGAGAIRQARCIRPERRDAGRYPARRHHCLGRAGATPAGARDLTAQVPPRGRLADAPSPILDSPSLHPGYSARFGRRPAVRVSHR